MRIRHLHAWDLSTHAARAVQEDLADQVRIEALGPVRTVAGCDLSFVKGDPRVWAGVVVMEVDTLEVLEEAWAASEATFPYVPGFLSFREIPPLVPLFEGLRNTPDAVICDGHGIVHPRRLGLAAHLGLVLDIPCVGCAKSPFVGEWEAPETARGSTSPITLDGAQVGTVLRSRDGVKPVFVSPGHRADIPGSLALVERCLTRYRLPETTRAAHQLVNRVRKGMPTR